MKQKAIINLLLVSSMFLMFSGKTQAGDVAAAKEKNSMCAGCHEIDGYRASYPTVYNVPKIGGQHAEYIAKALEAYKSGGRSHPTMTAIALTLSEQDIKDFAAYYAGK
ncbi:MAG: cytochrome c [Nitrosomonas sp.]|nr:cytochrome c [Nitrosomonas sp.]MDP1951146.1 cytochrome c [Nitrosomonas sp.]